MFCRALCSKHLFSLKAFGGKCCITVSSRIKILQPIRSSLNRKVSNSKQLQQVPETDQIHWASPCQSKQ